jgi:hypothetical protein
MIEIRNLGAPMLACAVWLSAGCGGTALPVRAQTDALASVRTARALGADTTPQASLHLALADDQIRQAERLIQQGRNDAAQRVLERAKADADLAIALQREEEVRAHAVSTQQQMEHTREGQHGTDGR